MTADILHAETLEHDGVSYHIVVYRTGSAYRATWSCPERLIGGALSSAGSIAKAVHTAKATILAEHPCGVRTGT